MHIIVAGAGLAGSEAAWALAELGHEVDLLEMRPTELTPAHTTGLAAELVCSNSLKSEDPASATGILKAEMRRLGSLVLRCADETRVPAGLSLAVDRAAFASVVSSCLRSHPRIHWRSERLDAPDLGTPVLLATGPLTAEPLSSWIAGVCGEAHLHFYDAIAPIVERDSIDMDIAFPASRYDKGTPDFLNCPLDSDAYGRFVTALLQAPRAPIHAFEARYFEACLPVEAMAERGTDTLRFGPMKPVGLRDPRTGRRPYAVVQLRQDTLAGDHYNLVGFQTRLTWGAQEEVFRLIPGLADAHFVRFGSIHRNTYLQSPQVLTPDLRLRARPEVWVAGQLAGVEGYLESAACGLAAAHAMDLRLSGAEPVPLPRETMLGSLLHYITHAEGGAFAPVNAMLGLLPELPAGLLDPAALKRSGGARALKAARGTLYRERALKALDGWLSDTHGGPPPWASASQAP